MSDITPAELWDAWRNLESQIGELRKALHEIEQVSSTILASLPPEPTVEEHDPEADSRPPGPYADNDGRQLP